MPQTQWNTKKTMQFSQESGQALLSDEQTLVYFGEDFGKLIQQKPESVCIPEDISALKSLIQFASVQELPVTIRGNGLSQSGQSLSVPGGLTVCMESFNKVLECADAIVWVEGNTSFSTLLESTLPKKQMPPVLPYNCNLSIGGVLSAGGVGASSFKYGPVIGHVRALEVLDGTGDLQEVDADSPLFHACLGGQGQFGIITKAALELRSFHGQLKTFFLVYEHMHDWLEDFEKVRHKIHYAELFCSPCIQGSKLTDQGRAPIAQWLFGMHISVEFEQEEPDLKKIAPDIRPWKILHTQTEAVNSFVFRHNGRFEAMKKMGQWNMIHPWYECFIPTALLKEQLPTILNTLPLHFANLIQIVPIAPFKEGFFQLPEDNSVCAFMILNPGIPEFLTESTLQAMQKLDALFLNSGGKRYLSGYLGNNITTDYWKKHFGVQYQDWVRVKKEYDPAGIFSSRLFQRQ